MRIRPWLIAVGLLLLSGFAAGGGEPPLCPPVVLLEAEACEKLGGWVIDQQFMDQMGSPYLLAHGLGVPVEDARTTVAIPAAGKYRVLVRTRDWVATWKAPGTPGKFQVLVGGKPLPAVFGTEGAEWHWQDGGTIELPKGKASVVLHDLTGFEGRCDAFVFSADPEFVPPNRDPQMAAFRRQALGLPEQPEQSGQFDLVVVGGGIAGTCAALSAARLGLGVALVQDRPVLGGNNSSEVRVWLGGETNFPPYPRIGDVVRELDQRRRAHYGPSNTADLYEDDKKLAVVRAEKNIKLFLNCRANAVEKDGPRIRAVIAQDVVTGRRLQLAGRWFADCTGDGEIGFRAGADCELTPKGHMGPCNLWNVLETPQPVPFPRCPWALDLGERPFPGRNNGEKATHSLGVWYWESGFDRDPIQQREYVRDWNFRAMYGAWDALKNVEQKYPNHKLNWAAHVCGPRESRRLLGDVVLGKEDLVGGKTYPDGCSPATWSIDLHLPDPRYEKGFEGDAFISRALYTSYQRPYWVPYRCLYSRNVPNLLMAGRDISVTHEALGAVRVMRTCGMMGEVVGMAAAVCAKHDTDPRGVYEKHLDELKELMTRGVGKAPLPSRDQPTAPKGAAVELKPPEWLKTAGPNLARLARVTVSGSLDAAKNPPALLSDGRIDLGENASRWLSDKRLPHQVELVWEKPQTLSAVRIVSGYHQAGGLTAPLRSFSFQYHDGTTWQQINDTKVTDNEQIDWHTRFPAVSTDRLRLVVTATPTDVSRIWEIEVYNAPNSD